jgi:hypothetical protein
VWRDWVSALLSSSSIRVLMIDNPGDRICHACGLRQGDPLSPMMFVIVMEVLNGLFRKANELSLYHSLGVRENPSRMSLYADDLAIFVSPLNQDLQPTRGILDIFQAASGLACNINKSQLVSIRCSEEQVNQPCLDFP